MEALVMKPEVCENRRFVCEPYHGGVGRITRLSNCQVHKSWMNPGETWATYSVEIETDDHWTYSRLGGSSSCRQDTRQWRYQLHGVRAEDILDPERCLRYVYPV